MTGHIPSNLIDEVRSAVNIVDIISQYVSLTKKGKDYVGLCPFHQEKHLHSPSVNLSNSLSALDVARAVTYLNF